MSAKAGDLLFTIYDLQSRTLTYTNTNILF